MNITNIKKVKINTEHKESSAIKNQKKIDISCSNASSQCRAFETTLTDYLEKNQVCLNLTERKSLDLIRHIFQDCENKLKVLRSQFLVFSNQNDLSKILEINQVMIDLLDEYSTIEYGYKDFLKQIQPNNMEEELKDEMFELFPEISQEELDILLTEEPYATDLKMDSNEYPNLDACFNYALLPSSQLIGLSKPQKDELTQEMQELFGEDTNLDEIHDLLEEIGDEPSDIESYKLDYEVNTWIGDAIWIDDKSPEVRIKTEQEIEDELFTSILENEKANDNPFSNAQLIINPISESAETNSWIYKTLSKGLKYIPISSYMKSNENTEISVRA